MGLQRYYIFSFVQIFFAFFYYLCPPLFRRRTRQELNRLNDMDIELLSRMVGELILDSEEVTLPGLGTFVTEMVPATFADKGYTINPPYRRLSFRQKETADNSLVRLYASSNKLDLQTASSILSKYIKGLREQLITKKTIVFPGLGRLRATKENTFFFIADESLNIYPEGFGLEPVSLKTHVETEEEVQDAVATIQSYLEDPLPASTPAPVRETAPEPEPISEPAPVPEPIPEPVPAPQPEQQRQPKLEPEPQPKLVPEVKYKPRRRRTGWWIAGSILLTLALLLGAFLLAARFAPDFLDTILYTEEELEIIHRI